MSTTFPTLANDSDSDPPVYETLSDKEQRIARQSKGPGVTQQDLKGAQDCIEQIVLKAGAKSLVKLALLEEQVTKLANSVSHLHRDLSASVSDTIARDRGHSNRTEILGKRQVEGLSTLKELIRSERSETREQPRRARSRSPSPARNRRALTEEEIVSRQRLSVPNAKKQSVLKRDTCDTEVSQNPREAKRACEKTSDTVGVAPNPASLGAAEKEKTPPPTPLAGTPAPLQEQVSQELSLDKGTVDLRDDQPLLIVSQGKARINPLKRGLLDEKLGAIAIALYEGNKQKFPKSTLTRTGVIATITPAVSVKFDTETCFKSQIIHRDLASLLDTLVPRYRKAAEKNTKKEKKEVKA